MLLAAGETFFGMTGPQFALVIGLIALLFSVTRWRKLMIQKHRNAPPPPPPIRARNDAHINPLNVHEIATELHALVADLEETARRVTAQIDNRYTRLEQLLDEADEKIRRLESAVGDQPTSATATPAPLTAEVQPTSAAKPSLLTSDAQRTLSRLRAERGAPAPADDPAYQPIYSLADRGKTPREIAQQLNRHQGEIELILALRQRQAAL